MGDMADYYIERMYEEELDFQLEMEDCVNSDMWVTANHEHIPLSELSLNHLENILRLILSGEVPEAYDYYLPKIRAELDKRKSEIFSNFGEVKC